MITLTAKIEVIEDKGGKVSQITSSLANNISSIPDIIEKKQNVRQPFIIGSSKLNSGKRFSSGEKYFISKSISDENGKFSENISFVITGSNIKVLNFNFDGTNNIYPQKIIVNGTSYRNESANFSVSVTSSNVRHTVYFNDMNKNNTPLIVSAVYTGNSIEINNNNLRDLSVELFDRSDLKSPSFGIISNKGNIEFNDTDGRVLEFAKQNILNKGSKCLVYLNNTLAERAMVKVGDFETETWDYDNDNRVVSVSIKDDLEEWQDIYVSEISYDPRNQGSKPFKWLYEHLWAITKENYTMLSFDELNTQTQDVLNNTYIRYPLLESGSLWQQWTKLCQVCQLHIYKNNNGVIVCRYNGGN